MRNEVKLYSGVAIEGYFDRGAATNKAVNSQKRTVFRLIRVMITGVIVSQARNLMLPLDNRKHS